MSAQLDFLGDWLGLDRDMYYLDAETTLSAQARFNRRFGGVGILGPDFGLVLEASAFGAEVRFSTKTSPWVIPSCDDLEEVQRYVEGLREPDPLFSGRLPMFYQSYFFMKKTAGGELDVPLAATAAIDIASSLIGVENLCLGIKLTPDTIHQLLNKINRFLIRYIETKARLFGVASIERIELYGDNAGLMSRDDFREFVLPYNKAIYDYFKGDSTVCLYHSDGDLSHIIDLLPEMGVNCLYSFDPHTDLQEFVDAVGDSVCLIGNIDPIRILRGGTVAEVEGEVKRLLDIGKRAKSFVISPGGELVSGTPEENIDTLLETVEQYGKY